MSESERPPVIMIVRGEYDIFQLLRWRNSFQRVAEIPGVVSIDLNERHNRLKVGIETETLRKQVEEALEEDGVPLAAVIIEATAPITFF